MITNSQLFTDKINNDAVLKNLFYTTHKLRLGWQFTFPHNNDPKHTKTTGVAFSYVSDLNSLTICGETWR